MVDVVGVLCSKRARLIKEQRDLEHEYEARRAHIGHELQMINHALEVINEAVEPFLCPSAMALGLFVFAMQLVTWMMKFVLTAQEQA